LFGEQISHHPAITAIQVRTPTNHWRIDVQFCFGIDHGMVKVDILQRGRAKLQFADGTVHEWEFPTIRALGILKGDRIVRVKGGLVVKDLTNHLELKLKVAPKPSKKRRIPHPRATTVWGGVTRYGAHDFLAMITGDYCDTIYFNGSPAWTITGTTAHRACVKVPDDAMLRSDARFRIDRAMLIRGDMDRAEEAKALLEDLQRRDTRLRTSNPSQ
jgi:hypothetical protein